MIDCHQYHVINQSSTKPSLLMKMPLNGVVSATNSNMMIPTPQLKLLKTNAEGSAKSYGLIHHMTRTAKPTLVEDFYS